MCKPLSRAEKFRKHKQKHSTETRDLRKSLDKITQGTNRSKDTATISNKARELEHKEHSFRKEFENFKAKTTEFKKRLESLKRRITPLERN